MFSYNVCRFDFNLVVCSPGRQSFLRLAKTDYVTPFSIIFYILCIHLVSVGPLPPSSLNRSIRYASSGCERGRPSDEQRELGALIAITPSPPSTPYMLEEDDRSPPLEETCYTPEGHGGMVGNIREE